MSGSGIHGFDGSYSPIHANFKGMKTFSLGVFEVLKTKDELRYKKGKVKVRVIGHVSEPDRVYQVARVVADQLDAGTYNGPKSIKAWMYAI